MTDKSEEQQNASTYQRTNLSTASVEVIPSGGFRLGMLPEIGEYLADKE